MRILLIDPPYERLIGFKSEWFPLGLTYIASYLIKKGFYDVCVYNGEHALDTEYKSIVKYADDFHGYSEIINAESHYIWDEIKQVVRSFKPDIVVLSVLTAKVPSAFRIAEICKKEFPEVKIIAGGFHPTINPEEVLGNRNIDFIVRGEGEETISELLKSIKQNHQDYSMVRGVSFREGDKIVSNPPRPLIEDLDTIPLPARNKLYQIETYTPTQLNMVMTSRGCPYNCGFCASETMWHRKVRYFSIRNVLKEIYELKEKYAVKHINFIDDAFTVNKVRVKEMCEALISENFGITWTCLTRVDMISDEIIELMKKAGCIKVDVGIESGNERVLNLINKKITLSQVREAVKVLRRNKMFWSGFFMFGFPTETEEEVLDTLKFLKELKPDWANVSIFTPYPGTALYDLAKERGMFTEPIDYTSYSHQNPHDRFTDAIDKERFGDLAQYILKEVHKYNSSYRSLIRRGLSRKYHKNPKLFFQDLKKVVSWLKK